MTVTVSPDASGSPTFREPSRSPYGPALGTAGSASTTALSKISIGADGQLGSTSDQASSLNSSCAPPPLPSRKSVIIQAIPPSLPPRSSNPGSSAQSSALVGTAPTPAQSSLVQVMEGSSSPRRTEKDDEGARRRSSSVVRSPPPPLGPPINPTVVPISPNPKQDIPPNLPPRTPQTPQIPQTPPPQSSARRSSPTTSTYTRLPITPSKPATQGMSAADQATKPVLVIPDIQSSIDATVGTAAESVASLLGHLGEKAGEVLPGGSSASSAAGQQKDIGTSPHFHPHSSQAPLPSQPLPLPPVLPTFLLAIICLTTYYTHSLTWTTLIALGCWYIWADAEKRQAERDEDPTVGRDRVRGPPVGDEDRAQEESVEWMNHALKALFPLISTDLLTPILDLLEDALLTQVPAIIPSVRLTSLSLGREPIRILSMRPMSDAEWFANLSNAPSAPGDPNAAKNLNPFNPFQAFHRNAKARSQPPKKDATTREKEIDDRSKRDEVLRDIGGVRGQGVGSTHKEAQRGEGPGTTAHDDGFAHGQTRAENTGVRGDEEGTNNRTDDDSGEDAGQYLNLAVDFAYDGRKNKGDMTFHFLGYFGMGVKGFGQTEIPIWIELLKITGTVHMRMLLSPSIPFVRTASISLPEIPEFDLSAKPIKSLSLDFMGLPLVKPFMEKSVRIVADAFVRPRCYSLDLDRILLGQEASIRTAAIGCLHIKINRANGLKAADTVGSSDPYCAISFTKLSKPLFSTRIIIDTLSPRWSEDAYILVTADAVESGERVRLTIYDSDRFSADDALGMVDRDLCDMLQEATTTNGSQEFHDREDALVPTSKGMRCQGSLTWSYRFAPLWKLPQDSSHRSEIASEEWDKEKHSQEDIGTGRSGPTLMPGAMYELFDRMKPEALPWQAERQKRRLESIAWLTGVRARETMEATEKPKQEFRSGVLQVTIAQCIDLELQGNHGTYGKAKAAKRGAKGSHGGAPALEDIINMGAWESDHPPSAYCEIILNGRLVYRTRTKQLTAAPYWNAITERLIRDWTKARLVIVVRDERDREHDPVLGIVAMDLSNAFHHGCQITRNYPLVGGQGWGQLRLSLLFKPLDIKLPQGISGYEVATVELHGLRFTPPAGRWDMNRLTVLAETDVDSRTLERSGNPGHHRNTSSSSLRKVLSRTPSQTPSFNSGDLIEWPLQPRRNVLAVQYRHSCFMVIRFAQTAGALKKDETVGIAVVRLADVPDHERINPKVPIYESQNMNEACERALDREEALQAGRPDPEAGMPTVEVAMTLHAGISKAHRKFTKKDKRMLHVYEAWELAQDVGDKADAMATSYRGKEANNIVNGAEQDGISSSDDEGLESDQEYHGPKQDVPDIDVSGNPDPGDLHDFNAPDEDDIGFYRKWREQRRALHRHNKGIMGSKLARTLKFGKDKLEEKMRQGGASVERNAHQQGSDLTVEMEGQSRLG